MKTIQFLALAAIGTLTMNHSCREPATNVPCPDPNVAGTSVSWYPCVPDQTKREAQLFVVNSQQEFGDAFTCSSYRPRAAAFQDSTLLVGWKQYCCCGHVKSQRLTYSCVSNTYTYQVEIEQGVCAAAMPVTSQLLVPKLPAGANVVIDMQ